MADLDETELKKLTVAQLKDLLKERDLPLTGKKAELIERLLETPGVGGSDIVEKAKSPEAAAATSPTPAPAAKAAPTTAAAAKSPPVAATAANGSATGAASADDKKAAREAKFGTGDKVTARAARFGIPVKGTAAADGVAKSAVPKSGGGVGGGKAGKAAAAAAALSPEAIEKLKQRAEKFGTVATASPILKQVLTAEQKAAEAERLAKRKAKFGIVDSPAADERKKARMEKFGTAPAGGGGKGGKGAPAAAKAAAAPARVLTEEEKAKIEARKARFN